MNYYNSNNFIVYKHTTPSGKCYIGYTQQEKLSYRARKDGSGYRYNVAFWNAICKYGWDNIKHEILKDHLSFNEANKWEIYYIQKYKANDKKFGYNLTPGGSNPNCTPETREKISKSKTGKYYYKDTRIYQYNSAGDLIGFYHSYRDAEIHTGINLYAVASCCRKKGVAKNFVFSKVPIFPPEIKERFRKQSNTKYIYTYDILFDKELPKINGLVAAAKTFQISQDSICISASNNPNRDLRKEFPHGYCFQTIPFTKELIQNIKIKFWSKAHRNNDILRWKKERNYCEKYSN